MNRGIWIVLALLAVEPALGQNEAKKDTTTAPKAAKAPKTGSKKAGTEQKAAGKKPAQEGGSSAWGTGGPSKGSVASKAAPPPPPHAAERKAMLHARSMFRYAVDACEQQGRSCDTTLREDAARTFLNACLPCATREQCEAERDTIRNGSSKSTTTLCTE